MMRIRIVLRKVRGRFVAVLRSCRGALRAVAPPSISTTALALALWCAVMIASPILGAIAAARASATTAARSLLPTTLLVGSMLINPFLSGGSGFVSGFATITIDHTKLPGSLTNVPMLFTWTDAALKTVANGGQVGNVNDISFATSSGGSVDLVWDNAVLTETTGFFSAFVTLPAPSSSVDTVIYLRWDSTGRGSSQGGSFGAAYDTNFKGVYHLCDGAALSLIDATANHNNLTASSNVTVASGDYRGVARFNGTSSQFTHFRALVSTGAGTIFARVKPDATGSGFRAIACVGRTTTRMLEIDIDSSGRARVGITQGVSNFKDVTGTTVLSTSVFSSVHGTYDGTNLRIYVNGVLEGTFSAPGTADSEGEGAIGSIQTTTWWKGDLGEQRYSNIARSPNWIAAEHNYFNAPIYTVT